MTFQREGDPLDVAARAAAAQLRCEASARSLSDKINLAENTTDWDAIFCAERRCSAAFRTGPARNASIVRRYRSDVAGPKGRATRREPHGRCCLRCGVTTRRPGEACTTKRPASTILGYQVERERGELARFVIFIGLAALRRSCRSSPGIPRPGRQNVRGLGDRRDSHRVIIGVCGFTNGAAGTRRAMAAAAGADLRNS